MAGIPAAGSKGVNANPMTTLAHCLYDMVSPAWDQQGWPSFCLAMCLIMDLHSYSEHINLGDKSLV